MKLDPRSAAALAVLLAAALALGATQDKAAAGARVGVLNVRECLDKARNPWMAEIEEELLKMQQADSGRASDPNPGERSRIRAKILDHANKRRLELYAAIVRISGAVAKERGFDLVQRADRVPTAEPGDADVMSQLATRDIVYADPGIDITSEVLDRVVKEHAARKK
jgi:Skp family chaperone for outer membrane proteins